MPSWAEIRASLDGAALLFAHKPDGMRRFDVSSEGFFRSFAAILLLLPFIAITLVAERQLIVDLRPQQVEAVGFGAHMAARALVIALEWALFPVIMAFIARGMGLERNYGAFVVAHNWTTVLSGALLTIPWIIYALGLIGPQPAIWVQFVLLIVWGRYAWFTAKTALDTSSGVAVGIVVLDFVLGLALERLGARILGL